MGMYLVTTAEECTWPENKNILFLGQWCLLYNRKKKWECLDYQLANPIAATWNERREITSEVEQLRINLLRDLVIALNHFHDEKHSPRYWEIILGHWLKRYVATTYNRYCHLNKTLRSYQITGATVLAEDAYSLITNDSEDFVWASNDSIWNLAFYSRLLRHFKVSGLKEIKLGTSQFARSTEHATPTFKQKILQSILKFIGSFLYLFSSDSDAFILNSYLPKLLEIRLQAKINRVPQIWEVPPLPKYPYDLALRKKFSINKQGSSEIDNFLRSNISDFIPACFIEGYQDLQKSVESLPWPSTPRFIFTSNNFDTDEIFKIWTAKKTEEGTPYFTGQHGNNYGCHIWDGTSTWPERSTADKFLSWGWRDEHENVVPAFIFKTHGRKSFDLNAKQILLIENLIPHRVAPYDNYSDFAQYQIEQFDFVDALSNENKERLLVRIHSAAKRFTWNEEQRWVDRYPNISIETGARSIWDLIRQSQIVIHSYDSTGILETLSLNIPTICFWRGGLDHLLPSAIPFYKLLSDAEILFYSPEEAARNVNEKLNDINSWWNSSKVQNARRKFCEQYARSETKPISLLHKLFLESNANEKNF